jgi:hypothetical protein
MSTERHARDAYAELRRLQTLVEHLRGVAALGGAIGYGDIDDVFKGVVIATYHAARSQYSAAHDAEPDRRGAPLIVARPALKAVA